MRYLGLGVSLLEHENLRVHSKTATESAYECSDIGLTKSDLWYTKRFTVDYEKISPRLFATELTVIKIKNLSDINNKNFDDE